MIHPALSFPKPNITFPVSSVVGAGVSNPILQNEILPAQEKETGAETASVCTLGWAVVQQHALEQWTSLKHSNK